jgi:transposase
MKKELYIGLDAHREAVAIAVAEQGGKGEVRDYGQISNDLHALEKFITRLRQTHGKRVTLRACYEAGPCGFGVARRLQQVAVECAVVAPSLTPTRAGDRLKSDKRDARNLARLLLFEGHSYHPKEVTTNTHKTQHAGNGSEAAGSR